jgi:secreted trypsin-like serine protease
MTKIAGLSALFALCTALTGCAADVENEVLQEGDGSSEDSIVGGTRANAGDFPAMAALVYAGTMTKGDNFEDQFCGGTLLDPSWVLTAAHCIRYDDGTDEKASDFAVLLGSLNLKNKNQGKRFAVRSYRIHENYDTTTHANDIALIRLATPATGYPVAQLPRSGKLEDSFWATGWGATKDSKNPEYPAQLQKVDLKNISVSVCNSERAYAGRILPGMMCAGYMRGGKDVCYGDSGGPLFTREDNVRTLVGITSWGDGCALKNAPTVYTKVYDFLPWVAQVRQAGR